MDQAGLSSGASAGTITFATAFGAAPRAIATPAGNDTNKIKMTQLYNITATGFDFNKTEMTSGSSTVSISGSGDAFSWIAVGNAP